MWCAGTHWMMRPRSVKTPAQCRASCSRSAWRWKQGLGAPLLPEVAKVKPVVKRYENTGVRIEDDYIVTKDGLERISNAPREIAEIEALMAKRPPRMVP